MVNFIGGPNSETFEGGADDDTAAGNGGNDTFNGNGGADVLEGGEGADFLGSAGPLGTYQTPWYTERPYIVPQLDRSGDADSLNGGTGDDVLLAGYGDNVDGGDGTDQLFISFQGASAGVTFDMSLSSQVIGGGTIQNVENALWTEGSAYGDLITFAGGYQSYSVVFGMGGNDTLVAAYTMANMFGGDGDDLVDGRTSSYIQRVDGGAGNDTLYSGTSSFSTAVGGDGDDLIHASYAISGGAGNDTIQMVWFYFTSDVHGDAGNDDLRGVAGKSATFFGDAGHDTLTGNDSNDLLTGGAGNDRLIGGGNESDTTGDIAVYGGASTDYQVTEDSVTHLITVVDLRSGSPDGTDTLDRSIEALRFSDGTYLVDVVLSGVGLGGVNFVGGEGEDVYLGSEDDNTATGKGGNDTLGGSGGNDSVQGDGGADQLNGGAGHDYLYSAAPPGAFHLPFNNDTTFVPADLDRGSEADTVNGGDGSDFISAGYGDQIDGGDGYDRLWISFQGAPTGVSLDANLSSHVIGSGTIQSVEDIGWIEGSEYADTFVGSRDGSFTSLFGMGGDDNLKAGYYTSSLFGGDGNDLVDGRGADYLSRVEGGAGNDTLYTHHNSFAYAYGGDGDDLIYAHGRTFGGAGNDTIQMVWTYYSDTAEGGDGDDDMRTADNLSGNMLGQGGNDTFRGGSGGDWFTGGVGNDSFIGADRPFDYAGDVAVYSGASSDYQVTEDPETHLITVVDLRPDSPEGTDTLERNMDSMKFSDGLYLIDVVLSGAGLGVKDFVGGDGDDKFGGSEGHNTAVGKGGNDAFNGNGGDDTLTGNGGNDVLNGGGGADYLYSGEALSGIQIDHWGDVYTPPVLDRGGETDNLNGGAGGDVLSAGYGDNIDGGDATDVLYISFQGASAGVTFNMGLASQVVGGGTIQNVESAGWIEGSEYGDILTDGGSSYGGNRLILGMGGNDTISAGYYSLSLLGNEGADVIDGRGAQNLIRADGGAGNDTIYTNYGLAEGGDGDDAIFAFGSVVAGAGNDTITMTGNDYFFGGSVWGGDGNDVIDGTGRGPQAYSGEYGNDTIVGGAYQDTLSGDAGDDNLTGGVGDDQITGGEGVDTVSYAGAAAAVIVSLTTGQATGGAGNDSLNGIERATGSAYSDQLTGSAGSDMLDGGAGNDTLSGALGDDSYVVDAVGDQVIEMAGEGVDTVLVSVGVSLAAYVENLTLTGADNLNGIGNDLANVISGNAGNNRLDGGAGNDTLTGGLGNDTFVVDSAADSITELAGGGTDLVQAALSWNLGANFENLTFTGTSNVTGNGNGLANVVTGNSGNNWLEGGAGNDTLVGGAGNDTFVVDAEDMVTENAGEGNDWVLAARSYTLGANFENLALLSGGGHFTVTGNAAANRLGGNSGNNVLDGMGGNDILAGGQGNDTYVVDAAGDVVTENASEGTDTVMSSVSFVLGSNLENLVLTGTADVNGAGNGLNNALTGNAVNNLLDGGAGSDRMVGGLGNDTYIVDNAGDSVGENHLEGTDTIFASVSYSLFGRAVEILTLTGAGNLTGTGNSLNNLITGNGGNNTLDGAAGNDVLDGGAGIDRLLGGLGDDTYYVDNAADSVGENHLEGTDTIISSVSYSLFGRAVEVLTLTGAGNLNGTGNGLNNTLNGNAGNNVLDGGAGVDKLVGGLGDDTYYVDNAGDNVQEQHLQGTDTVFSSVTYSLLGRAVEVMTLTGAANINATGNSLNNSLTGNSGNNRLDGGVGNDTLAGGLGADVFVFMAGTWKDTVSDFSAAQNDSIDIHAITNGVANNGMVTQLGGNVLINLGGGNTVTVLYASQADVLSHMEW